MVETPEQVTARERAEFEKRRRAQIAQAALELDHVDGRILELLLKFPGITQDQIGDLVSLRRQAVSLRMLAPKFQAALQVATRSALEVYHANQARAARRLGELISSVDERVALRATIAQLWEFIHTNQSESGADFVRFIQEAYELAEGQKAAKAGPADHLEPAGDARA